MTQIVTVKATPAIARRISRAMNALDLTISPDIQELANQDTVPDHINPILKPTIQQLVDNNLSGTFSYMRGYETEANTCIWTAAELLNVKHVSLVEDSSEDFVGLYPPINFDTKTFCMFNRIDALKRSDGIILFSSTAHEQKFMGYFKHGLVIHKTTNQPFFGKIHANGRDKHYRNHAFIHEAESIVCLDVRPVTLMRKKI